jgi:hypothetical protein
MEKRTEFQAHFEQGHLHVAQDIVIEIHATCAKLQALRYERVEHTATHHQRESVKHIA